MCYSVCMCSNCARQTGNRQVRQPQRALAQAQIQARILVRPLLALRGAATPSTQTLCPAIACLSMLLTPHQILRHVHLSITLSIFIYSSLTTRFSFLYESRVRSFFIVCLEKMQVNAQRQFLDPQRRLSLCDAPAPVRIRWWRQRTWSKQVYRLHRAIL